MKLKNVLLLFLLSIMAPAALFADHMATCITIFDAATLKTMVATNGLRQVPDGVLYGESTQSRCRSRRDSGRCRGQD